MKRRLVSLWALASHIRFMIALGGWMHRRIPVLGKILAMISDRVLLILYGVDVTSHRMAVKDLHIPHPGGVLLGGNGITSPGKVVINAGVKFVGHSPKNPAYLERHAQGRVFDLGRNIIIGSNSVIMGPVTICDNVVIGAMSLVNKDITEPGTYVGCPVRKISDDVSSWL